MTPEEIADLLRGRFGDAIVDVAVAGSHPYVEVKAERWPEVATFLRDDSRLRFNVLRCVSAIDLLAENKLACVYDVQSISIDRLGQLVTQSHEFAARVTCDRDNPSLPSVSHVWPAADWHEREAYDLMGIPFTNHPDLRRILCPDDWEGYPLRKDYAFPLEYHGIPATTEYELTNPRH